MKKRGTELRRGVGVLGLEGMKRISNLCAMTVAVTGAAWEGIQLSAIFAYAAVTTWSVRG